MPDIQIITITATPSPEIVTVVVPADAPPVVASVEIHDIGPPGTSAYASYLATTDHEPPLSEEEWSSAGGGGGSSTFAGLVDKITAPIATVNESVAACLAEKAAINHNHAGVYDPAGSAAAAQAAAIAAAAAAATATVINSLTSDVTDAPLSAAQGKALNDAYTALAAALNSPDTDLDDFAEVVAFITANRETLDALAIANIAGLETALSDLWAAIGAAASQVEAEAATEPTIRRWSPLRIGQAIAARVSAIVNSAFVQALGFRTSAATDTLLDAKANTAHTHDDRYYTESETDTLLSGKANSAHAHDDRYYTESESDTLLSGKANTSHTHGDLYYTEAETDALLANKIATSLKGAANGLAELDSGGLVPASQLPSYVDDVIEAANFAALPGTGATGKIYVTLADNLTYRWGGSAYVEISASLALGETSSTAYRGDRGKAAYDHSQATGNPHGLTKADLNLGNVENTALSTWAGNTSISSVGTITVGTWQGTAIADAYIASAATWNAKVSTTDPRLSDARTPSAHTHTAAAITDFAAAVAANSAVAANTAKVGAVEYIGGTNALAISAGVVAVNAANGRSQKLTLTADVTSFGVPSNLADGQSMAISGKQDGTGGRAFTLAAGYVIIGGGLQADISALTANKRFLLAIVREGSSYLVTIATE